MRAINSSSNCIQHDTQNDSNSDHLIIKELKTDDFSIVKDFILEQHRKLVRKDFFITDDLNTELPVILEEGLVIGLFHGDVLIGIQALDMNKENSAILKDIISPTYTTSLNIYELGWTIIHTDYRNNSYAHYLVKNIIEMADISDKCVLLVTIHPENVAAIHLYEDFGFQPIFQTKYYGYERVFMLKEVNVHN